MIADQEAFLAEVRRTRREDLAVAAPITLIDANESLHQNPDRTRFTKPITTADGCEIFPMPLLVKEAARLSVMYADALIAELDGGEA